MNVTLKNKTGRAKVIVLDHPAFRTKAYGFRRRLHQGRAQAKDGSIATKTVPRDEPGSITLPAKGEVTGLHPAIKNCAQVRSLLARGAVAIIPENAPTAKPSPSTPKRRAPKASTSTVSASSEATGKGDA